MSTSQNLKFRIRSSPHITNKKSESVKDYVKSSCIPRRCESSMPKLPSSLSGSKQNGRLDLSESDMNVEGIRKRHKSVSQVTMEAGKCKVPLESVVSKPAKLTGRSFKIRFKRGREGESVSGKETSNVDGGRSPILSSNLKKVKSNEDQENIPSQKRLALEDNSADIGKTVKEIKENCAKRMEKLIQEQKGKIQEFHRVWEDNMSKLENDRKLEAAIIRSIYGKQTITIDKLAILDDKFAKKMAENNLEKDKQLKDLEAEQSAARNEEIQKEANSLSKAKARVSSKPTAYRKDQPFGSQHEEVSRCSTLRTHILGAKDAMALTEQHGKNSDSSRTVKGSHVVRTKNSDRATAEEVACNPSYENPSSAAIISSIHGKQTTTIDKLRILDDKFARKMAENKHLKDLEAEQSAARNEEIQKAANSLSEAKACLSSKPTTVYHKEQSFGSQHEEVSRCSKLREHILGAKDAMVLTEQHGQNSDSSRTVKGNHVVRSKISDRDAAEEVSCNPSYENPSGEANSSQKKEGRISYSDIRIPAVVEKINLPKHLGAGGSILASLAASGERVPGEMQSLELHGEVPSEMPETVAYETLDEVAIDLPDESEMPETVPYETLDEDAIDLPDAEQLTQPEHFGCAEKIFAKPPASGERAFGDIQSPNLLKDIPAEFGEGTAINLPDALLNQRNETDRTTIDDLDLAGQVREEQDVVPSEIQGHGIEEAGKVNSSLSEIATAELVDTARESLSNIELQAGEELAIETQSSSRAEASTLKITDTVIAEQSSIQIQDQNTSVVKDQVTSLIEAADSERVDTAAPVSASELVGTVKTLESYNKLQDNAELETETRSMSRIEVSAIEDMNNTSDMLSSMEQQDEDAVIITNQVNLETEASNSLLPDNATPVQSHTDAPSIESDEQLQLTNIDASPSRNQLPSPELESQNHNPGRNSSGAAVTEMLSHESMSRLREDLEQQSNIPDVRDERTSVQISASVQNNVATEAVPSTNEVLHDAVLQFGGLTHLPINQVSPSLFADPLQNELEKIKKETEELQKSHDELIEGLKSECRKEMQELFDAVRKKYQLKIQDTQAQFALKNNGLCQKEKKILMNKILADSFDYNCLNMSSTWPWPKLLQGLPSSSMQYQQHMVRPAGACAPNPQIASPIGQAMPQISVPGSTRVGPITSQHFAPPFVQPTPHFEALPRHGAIFGAHPMSLPRLGGDIYSSAQQFQSSFLGPAQSMPNATSISSFQNLLQQQQPQQPLAAPQWPSNFHNPQHRGYPPAMMHTSVSSQWPSNFHNPQHRGYPPAVMHTSVSSFDSLMDVEHLRRHHQLLGAVHGNQSSCTGAANVICLSDEG